MVGSSAEGLARAPRSGNGSMTTQQSGGTPRGGLVRFFGNIGLFFMQVRAETRKVSWPSRETLKTYTLVVLASTVVLCILMGVVDSALGLALKEFIRLTVGATGAPTP